MDLRLIRPGTDLHALWDSGLIAQRLRTIPRNYTKPLPIPDVERHLRGTIYDPYIRRLVWEGILGRYADEYIGWLDCPAPPKLHTEELSRWQRVLGWFRDEGSGDGGLNVDDEIVCPYHWASTVHALNCEVVWPAELELHPLGRLSPPKQGHVCGEEDDVEDEMAPRRKHEYVELDTPEYAGRIRDEWIVEHVLTQAGVRLAAILNWLFEHEGNPPV